MKIVVGVVVGDNYCPFNCNICAVVLSKNGDYAVYNRKLVTISESYIALGYKKNELRIVSQHKVLNFYKDNFYMFLITTNL